jgi:segregation and condensation protein B
MSSLSTKIEAILYLKAQPLTVAKIAEYAACEREAVQTALNKLIADYSQRETALEVAETPNGYCLQLRDSYHELIQQLIPVDLGVGALRSLAAIALKGSISQTQLVELRGSGAYQHVQELVGLGFVRKRRQSDGRSFWLHVTEKFYQYFQVEQLPQAFNLASQTPGSLPGDLADDLLDELESDLGSDLSSSDLGSDLGSDLSSSDLDSRLSQHPETSAPDQVLDQMLDRSTERLVELSLP